mgnify:CR=1 FL=1
MKKKIIMILVLLISLFFEISYIKAGSLSINGNNSVYVNSNLTVKVNFNNIAGRFTITSSNQNVLSGSYDDFYDNQTVSLTFTAKSAGTTTITVTPVGAVGDYDKESYTGGSRSLTVTVLKKNTPSSIDVNKTYSKNNYLKNLDIEGYDLSPAFDKDKLEYTKLYNITNRKENL